MTPKTHAFFWRSLALAAVMGAATQAGAQEPDFAAEGRRLFNGGIPDQPHCALCHTLADAQASGAVGPDLNELTPDAQRIKHAMRNGIGPMPATTWLTDEQIELVARYVEWASKKP